MPDLTIITPTADQPTGIALCEKWIQRQTVWDKLDIEWIVAEDGSEMTPLTMDQMHITSPPTFPHEGYRSFLNNLTNAFVAANSPIIAICENDDFYHPAHLECHLNILKQNPELLASGDYSQRYYNVKHRIWRKMKNTGACLCQTAFRREAMPYMEKALRQAYRKASYGVDRFFWDQIINRRLGNLGDFRTVVGIKGLPGIAGLGIGHRPEGTLWSNDDDMKVLKQWVKDDYKVYEEFYQR